MKLLRPKSTRKIKLLRPKSTRKTRNGIKMRKMYRRKEMKSRMMQRINSKGLKLKGETRIEKICKMV